MGNSPSNTANSHTSVSPMIQRDIEAYVDLHRVTPGSRIFKSAVLPAVNSSSRMDDMKYRMGVGKQSSDEPGKSYGTHFQCTRKTQPIAVAGSIERVTSMKVLGVIVNDRLSATDHVSNLLSSRSSLLNALRVLRSRGIRHGMKCSNQRSLRRLHTVRQHGLVLVRQQIVQNVRFLRAAVIQARIDYQTICPSVRQTRGL